MCALCLQLGPAYASHLSTDQRAPHWVPQAAGTDTAAAGNKQGAAALHDTNAAAAAAQNAKPGRQTMAARRAEEPLPASITGRQQRRSAVGVAEAAAAAGKRPYRRKAVSAADAAGTAEQHMADAGQQKAGDANGDGHGGDSTPEEAQPDGDMQAAAAAAAVADDPERSAAANGNLSDSDIEMMEPSTNPAAAGGQASGRGVTADSPFQADPRIPNAAAGGPSASPGESSLPEDGGDSSGEHGRRNQQRDSNCDSQSDVD